MADELWIDVLPSMKGFQPKLAKETGAAAKSAGQKAGKEYSDAFSSGADGATSASVAELETAQKQAAGLVSKLSQDVSKARQTQQKSAAAVIDAEVKLAAAVEKSGADSDQARAAALRLDAARGKAEDDTRKFANSEEALKQAHNASAEAAKQLEKAQQGLGDEVAEQPKKWGKFGDAISTVGGRFEDFSGSVGGTVTQIAGAVGGAALLTEAFGTALEGDTAVDRLSAALGATPEQAEVYGAATGELYKNGFGESMEDVSNSVDAVVSSMAGMRDASQADIEKITGYAMNLAGAFDVDVAESATTAGSLIKNGLAADATDAFDLMTGAMQQIPQSLRGEVLPVMDEYGKHFAALGIDGETAMGMIVASSADGAIGMDKMGDALKEFTIRATDMSKGTSAVYDSLGLDMEDMTTKLLAGGETAEGAMAQIVHGLQEIKDPGEQAAASLALFGTPLEDLGTDQIPNFLGMVDPMGDAFGSLEGKAESMGQTLNDNAGTSIETITRSFMGLITDGIVPALGPLQSVMDWATNTPGVLEGVGIALGVVALAWGYLTLAASPWLAIALGIGAAIAGLVLVIMNWGTVMDWLKGNVLEPFLNWIAPAWDAVMTGMGWAWTNILKPVWDGIATAADWLYRSILQPVFKWIGEAWTNWTNNAKWAWENILKPAWNAVAAAGKWLWDNALKPAFGWIKSGWDSMISGIGWAWTNILKPIWDGVSAGAKWLYNYGIKPAMGWISDKWKAMVDGIGSVWDKYGKPVFSAISSLLKGDFVDAFEHGKKAVKNIWDGVANIVRKPINFVINTVYNDGLKSMFNGIAEKLGLSWRLPNVDSLPAFAKGGYHKGGWALVGEEGPELVNFSSPGRVYTAGQTQDMLAGREQAPDGSLQMLAGAKPADAMLPAGGFWGDVWGGVTKAVGTAKDWVVGKIAEGVRALTNPLKSTISSFLPGAGINELIRGGAHKVIDDMVGWAVGADDKKALEQAAASGGAVYDGPLGAFHRPSKGPFTSMYGPRWGGFHTGVDIAGGGPTYAALPGVVQRVGWNAVPGKTGIGIYLNHGPGLWTYYGHNPVGGPQVKVGDQVKAGEHIGYQGATGNVTGVHTHFEVHEGRVNGTVNPLKYMKYDNGGYLQPGVTPTLNATGKPEPVLTSNQWSVAERAIKLASQGAQLPEKLSLVVDGYEFTAYVSQVADNRMRQAKAQSRQMNRQLAGSNN